MVDVNRNAPAPIDLGIASAGKLSLNRSALEKGSSVRAAQFDGAKQFLEGLDAKATVRIINGRQSGKNLALGTKTGWDFFSRKPLTREFFKQACIAKFGNRAAEVGRAFDEAYGALNPKTAHKAANLLSLMQTLEQRFAPSVRQEASAPLIEPFVAHAAGPARSSAEIEPQLLASDVAAEAAPIIDVDDVAVEEDVPDLVVEPQLGSAPAKPTEALTKAHGFSVQAEAPPFKPNAFNVIDSGEHAAVGKEIDARLEELGLRPKRGLSKIEVNGEKVYCYFDTAGKARAILPKGAAPVHSEVAVATVDLKFHMGNYREYVLLEGPFKGRDTEFNKENMDQAVVRALDEMIRKGRKDGTLGEARSAFFKPLEEEGRMVLQFRVGDDPWIVDLALVPGKTLKDLPAASGSRDLLSAVASPLDAPLPDGPASLAELAEKAAQGVFDKNTRIKLSAEYRAVRAAADGSYVKKFSDEYPEVRSAFFEHLLANENLAPGITNRMLGGVPTADKKKNIDSSVPLHTLIGPSGPLSMMARSEVPAARLADFEAAVITAVDDLLVLTKGGFESPEGKPDHYLCDMKAERIEIKMIDFGRSQDLPVDKRRNSFQKGVGSLLAYIGAAFARGNAAKNEVTSGETADAFIARIREYAAGRVGEIV